MNFGHKNLNNYENRIRILNGFEMVHDCDGLTDGRSGVMWQTLKLTINSLYKT